MHYYALLGFLDEALAAAGAGDVYLSLALWYAEIILAAGTLEESEVLTLVQLIHLTAEEILHLIPMAQEQHIFRTAPLNIAGKYAEYAKKQYRCRKRGYIYYSGYACDNVQRKRGNEYSKGQLVSAITSRHDFSQKVQSISPLLLRQRKHLPCNKQLYPLSPTYSRREF